MVKRSGCPLLCPVVLGQCKYCTCFFCQRTLRSLGGDDPTFIIFGGLSELKNLHFLFSTALLPGLFERVVIIFLKPIGVPKSFTNFDRLSTKGIMVCPIPMGLHPRWKDLTTLFFQGTKLFIAPHIYTT